MHARATLPGSGFHPVIERGVGKRADGDDDQIAVRAQYRLGNLAHAFHGRSLHNEVRLHRQQSVDVLSGAAARALRERQRGRHRPAGDTYQLIVRQQPLCVRIGDDAAHKAAAHDDKPLHPDNPSSCGFAPHMLSFHCTMVGRKRKAEKGMRLSVR